MCRGSRIGRGQLNFLPWALLASGVAPLMTPAQALLEEGDIWSYFKGTVEPPANWNVTEFDASGWAMGPSPFGYGDVLTGTQLTDMQHGYSSFYIRATFTLTDPGEVAGLNLRMRYDDGFVAYLNGTEFLRRGIPGAPSAPIPHTTLALDHETNATFEENWFCASALTLRPGENVLALQGHNVFLDSPDFALLPELVPFSPCATNLICIPNPSASKVLVRWRKPTETFAFDSLVLLRDGVPLPGPIALEAASFTDRDVPLGTHTYELRTSGCGLECENNPVSTVTLGSGLRFLRGDANESLEIDLSDAVWILNMLFLGGPRSVCDDAADANDDGAVDMSDSVYLLRFQFGGGPQPVTPFPACGQDPTADNLGCRRGLCDAAP